MQVPFTTNHIGSPHLDGGQPKHADSPGFSLLRHQNSPLSISASSGPQNEPFVFSENMKHPSHHIREDRILGEDELFCLLLVCGFFLRWSLTVLSALVPTHHPLLVVHFRGVCFLSAWFSIPVSAQLCFLLWNHIYTVCSALMCFRGLCSAAVVLAVHPQVNTPTYSQLWWETLV